MIAAWKSAILPVSAWLVFLLSKLPTNTRWASDTSQATAQPAFWCVPLDETFETGTGNCRGVYHPFDLRVLINLHPLINHPLSKRRPGGKDLFWRPCEGMMDLVRVGSAVRQRRCYYPARL